MNDKRRNFYLRSFFYLREQNFIIKRILLGNSNETDIKGKKEESMAKGRRSNPSTGNDGNWFCHEDVKPPGYAKPTTTSEMLETPFHRTSKSIKTPYFENKTGMNFKYSNTFSVHDNKRSFTADSAYFSYAHNNRTLGRRQYMRGKSLHNTDPKFLHHSNDVNSSPNRLAICNISHHDDKNSTDRLIFRRFPKKYSSASHGLLEPQLRASHWFKDPEDYKSSTQTLVNSLSPYVKHNPWKLSYHKISKVYPNLGFQLRSIFSH